MPPNDILVAIAVVGAALLVALIFAKWWPEPPRVPPDPNDVAQARAEAASIVEKRLGAKLSEEATLSDVLPGWVFEGPAATKEGRVIQVSVWLRDNDHIPKRYRWSLDRLDVDGRAYRFGE